MAAAEKIITSSTPFDQCVATIMLTAKRTGTDPVTIVDTPIMRVVRFPGADGSLLVSCSKPDSKMIMQQSDKICGVDVEC